LNNVDLFSTAALTTTWQYSGGRFTTPAGTAKVRINLYSYMTSGWVAFDDLSLKQVGSSTNLAPNPGFESGSSTIPARVVQFG
jgi:hypothetical protein